MKQLLFSFLLIGLAQASWASLSLPRIAAPEELSDGDFAEGTLTQLSSQEVAEFLPWAQNAQNQLSRALTVARTMPLRERPQYIDRAIRNVVGRSGGRQYQMFMRFALNRGMLLVKELEKFADMDAVGAQENALDILQRSIQVALSFYESDLSFQRRAQSGESGVELTYARFGASYMSGLYPALINVLDSAAQYRLMYKLVEMTNWDLSRDAGAQAFAEHIVEAHDMLSDLPAEPLRSDRDNLRNVRRLHGLRILTVKNSVDEVDRLARLSAEAREAELRRTQEEAARAELDRQRREELRALGMDFKPEAQVLYVDTHTNNIFRSTIVTQQDDGNFVIRINGQLYTNISPSRLAQSKGCVENVCVNPDRIVYNISGDNVREAHVVGIYQNRSRFVLYFPGSSSINPANLANLYGGGWGAGDIAVTEGCTGDICVGQRAINLSRKVEVEVVGRQSNGKFVLKFLSGSLAGKVGHNWDRSDLAKL